MLFGNNDNRTIKAKMKKGRLFHAVYSCTDILDEAGYDVVDIELFYKMKLLRSQKYVVCYSCEYFLNDYDGTFMGGDGEFDDFFYFKGFFQDRLKEQHNNEQ